MSGYSSGAHENQQFQLSYEEYRSLRRDVTELLQRVDAMDTIRSQGHVSDEAHHEAPSKCMGAQRLEGVPSQQRTMVKHIQEHAKMFPRSALERKEYLAAVHPTAEDGNATFSPTTANVGAVPEPRWIDRNVSEDPHPRRRQDEVSSADAYAIGKEGNLASTYLTDTVYLWACGEKGNPVDDEVAATDIAIGWITLGVQMITYVALIVYANNNEGAEYFISSITLAMFLMVAISAADIRAGYSLLFWGTSRTRRVFGALALTNAVLLIIASLSVLFMSAENNAELVIGATTVLFIEDVDNKLMHFLVNVRQRWRLFGLLESIGISFWLALAGILYVGDPSAVSQLEKRLPSNFNSILHPYFVCVFTPGALTMWALAMNSLANGVARAWREAKRDLEERGRHNAKGCSSVTAVLLSGARQNLWTVFAVVICGMLGSLLSFGLTWLAILGSFEAIYLVATLGVIGLVYFLSATLKASLSWCETRDRHARPLWYPMFIGWGIGAIIGTLTLFSIQASGYIALGCGLCIFPVGMLLFAEGDFLGLMIGSCLEGPIGCVQRIDGFVHWSIASAVHFLMVWWVTELTIYVWYGVFQ